MLGSERDSFKPHQQVQKHALSMFCEDVRSDWIHVVVLEPAFSSCQEVTILPEPGEYCARQPVFRQQVEKVQEILWLDRGWVSFDHVCE
jgi:hypothetical protein